ncbi:MAG TPA: FAD-dependent monooxygenase [Lapillicoccus sp.]|nr:FAD-dependent monooxygenase [Lapillicoccus sp.]
MKVLISGAGVAGLTAAYWLQQAGFQPVVVERAPSLVVGGYKIDVRGAALEVVRRMGLYGALADAGTDMQAAVLVDREGNELGRMTGDDFGHRAGDDLEVVRGELCTILQTAAPDVETLYGQTVTAVDQAADGVRVTLSGGETREVDVVVGADGLHSNVRGLVFGEESRFLRDLGMYLCVFSVPNRLDLDRMEMQYSERGRVAAIWATRDDADAKATFGFASRGRRVSLRDRREQEAAVRAAYEGVGWEVPRWLDEMSSATDWYFDVAAQIDLPSWSSGRVALAGDAGYCASPMSGQGSSLAILGAYVLAGELAAADGDVAAAFAEYDRVMRPYVDANQALGIRSAGFMTAEDDAAPELTGEMVESVIDATTERIAAAASAIELKDYSSRKRA